MIISDPQHTKCSNLTKAIFVSLVPAMCNHTSFVQVHKLPQSHCGDNQEGTLFSWLHNTLRLSCFWEIWALYSTPLLGYKLVSSWLNQTFVRSLWHLSLKTFLLRAFINSFITETVIIQKPAHWFTEQINGLVSIW